MKNEVLDILILGLLVVLFASIYRKRATSRVRCWLAGWILVLLRCFDRNNLRGVGPGTREHRPDDRNGPAECEGEHANPNKCLAKRPHAYASSVQSQRLV